MPFGVHGHDTTLYIYRCLYNPGVNGRMQVFQFLKCQAIPDDFHHCKISFYLSSDKNDVGIGNPDSRLHGNDE
jgi:hypothetical protein